MKPIFTFILAICLPLFIHAQEPKDFEVIINIKSTPLKDQQSSGTCWSFATTSFIETEAIRLGHDPVSLSAIYYVAPTYVNKAEKFIAKEGESWFDAGDLSFSVFDGYAQHGAIPEEVYNGMIEGDWQHDHLEMDNALYAFVNSIGTSGYGRIKPTSWKNSVIGILEAYLGKTPETFQYEGEQHTPQSFAEKFIGIKREDYVEITSYSHHDFYQSINLDIPANWNDNVFLNLPIQDFEAVIYNALENGYTIAWDGDASEPGFDFDTGIFVLPTEQEMNPMTQELRQSTFEDESTSDEHNMHIVGLAKNREGKDYFIIKNSEGSNDMDGYIYMSKNSFLLKTISFSVHKEAIPKSILKKTTIQISN